MNFTSMISFTIVLSEAESNSAEIPEDNEYNLARGTRAGKPCLTGRITKDFQSEYEALSEQDKVDAFKKSRQVPEQALARAEARILCGIPIETHSTKASLKADREARARLAGKPGITDEILREVFPSLY